MQCTLPNRIAILWFIQELLFIIVYNDWYVYCISSMAALCRDGICHVENRCTRVGASKVLNGSPNGLRSRDGSALSRVEEIFILILRQILVWPQRMRRMSIAWNSNTISLIVVH